MPPKRKSDPRALLASMPASRSRPMPGGPPASEESSSPSSDEQDNASSSSEGSPEEHNTNPCTSDDEGEVGRARALLISRPPVMSKLTTYGMPGWVPASDDEPGYHSSSSEGSMKKFPNPCTSDDKGGVNHALPSTRRRVTCANETCGVETLDMCAACERGFHRCDICNEFVGFECYANSYCTCKGCDNCDVDLESSKKGDRPCKRKVCGNATCESYMGENEKGGQLLVCAACDDECKGVSLVSFLLDKLSRARKKNTRLKAEKLRLETVEVIDDEGESTRVPAKEVARRGENPTDIVLKQQEDGQHSNKTLRQQVAVKKEEADDEREERGYQIRATNSLQQKVDDLAALAKRAGADPALILAIKERPL